MKNIDIYKQIVNSRYGFFGGNLTSNEYKIIKKVITDTIEKENREKVQKERTEKLKKILGYKNNLNNEK
jgi:hypothetical protein